MKRMVLMVVAILAVMPAVPRAQVRAEVALGAATELETVKGDLKGAIAAYQKIADGYPQNRAVRAQALVRMADCYQRLGDAKAREVFELVLRDFADQTESAATARIRLAASRTLQPATLSTRRLYDSPGLPDSVSEDGTKTAETDWQTGNIVIRDVASGRVRPVTALPPGMEGTFEEFGEIPILSSDGTQVAYTWCTTVQKQTATTPSKCDGYLRVAKVREGEIDTPRVLQSGRWWTAYDWSRDGKQIAAISMKPDKTVAIALVSVADGRVTVLKELGLGTQPWTMVFSPDGSHLAFDTALPEPSTQREAGDVVVMRLADKSVRPIAAGAARERLVGWTPDGSQILFTSDRNGTNDLFAAPVAAGSQPPRGTMLRGDLGSLHRVLRMSSSGALYYVKQTGGGSQIVRASVDFITGSLAEPRDIDSGTAPSWSPDGSALAYIARKMDRPGSRPTLRVKTLDRSAREIAPDLRNFSPVQWGTDANVVFTAGNDGRGKDGLWSIDLRTGATTFLSAGARQIQIGGDRRHVYLLRGSGVHEFIERDIASGAERVILSYESAVAAESAQVTKDGSKVYYRLPDAWATAPQPRSRLMERDVASGRERELFRGFLGLVSLSPDGRHVAIKDADAAKKSVAFKIVSTGEPSNVREVMRLNDATHDMLAFAVWGTESTAVLLNQIKTATTAGATWWVPIDGAAARRLSPYLGAAVGPGPVVGPDAKSVAFSVGNDQSRRHEIWVMEHFLPPPVPGPGRK